MKLFLKTVFVIVIFVSCNNSNNNFYKGSKYESDVCRFPIIRPFELIQTDCFSDDWMLFCENCNIDFLIEKNYWVDSINYFNGYIIFHSKIFFSYWGIINAYDKKIYVLDSKSDQIEFCRSYSLPANLFYADSIYKIWRKNDKLPWDTTQYRRSW